MTAIADLLINRFGSLRVARNAVLTSLPVHRNPDKIVEHFAHVAMGHVEPVAELRIALVVTCGESETDSALALDAIPIQARLLLARQEAERAAAWRKDREDQFQIECDLQRAQSELWPNLTIYPGRGLGFRPAAAGDFTRVLRVPMLDDIRAAVAARDMAVQLGIVRSAIASDQREPRPDRVRLFGLPVKGYNFQPNWKSRWDFTPEGELESGYSALVDRVIAELQERLARFQSLSPRLES